MKDHFSVPVLNGRFSICHIVVDDVYAMFHGVICPLVMFLCKKF